MTCHSGGLSEGTVVPLSRDHPKTVHTEHVVCYEDIYCGQPYALGWEILACYKGWFLKRGTAIVSSCNSVDFVKSIHQITFLNSLVHSTFLPLKHNNNFPFHSKFESLSKPTDEDLCIYCYPLTAISYSTWLPLCFQWWPGSVWSTTVHWSWQKLQQLTERHPSQKWHILCGVLQQGNLL